MQHITDNILLLDSSYSKYFEGLSNIGKAYGFNIKAFSTIEDGLSYLESHNKEIDAALIDLSFTPNHYEGEDALLQIKKRNNLLPVIMLAKSQSEKDMAIAVNCMRDGAFNYIVKSNFDPIALFKMLKIAVNQYNLNCELERVNALKEEYRSKISIYDKMINTTEMIITNILQDKLMFPPTFEKRIKTFRSFYNKIIEKEKKEETIPDPFKRISDIAGLRVIFYNAVDLQKAVKLLQETNDFVDWKTAGNLIPDDKSKTHGYRAVHFDIKLNKEKRLHLNEYQVLTNIPCEVQFKTIFAHSWSKVYHALSYKETEEIELSKEEQQELDLDFKEAAKKLESVEKKITNLCAKYYSRIKLNPNAN